MQKLVLKQNGGGEAVYGLGFIGAVIYYFQHATTFSGYILGFLKALVWPAFFVYKIMELFRF